MTRSLVLGMALVLGFDVGLAAAQQAPAQAPPPPAPQALALPAPVRPRDARDMAPPRPVATAPAAANRAPLVAEPVRPQTPGAPSPETVRPAAATAAVTPPANAVALCQDGTFILPPNDASACASHRGVLVRLPQAPGTPPPPTRSIAPVAASRAAVREAAPPAGATMRCKDGTYLFGAPADGRCANYGGLAAVLPTARETPPPPAPRRP